MLRVPSLHHKHYVVLFIFTRFLHKIKDLNSIKKKYVASWKTGNFATHY
jgi:hypothetical protein